MGIGVATGRPVRKPPRVAVSSLCLIGRHDDGFPVCFGCDLSDDVAEIFYVLQYRKIQRLDSRRRNADIMAHVVNKSEYSAERLRRVFFIPSVLQHDLQHIIAPHHKIKLSRTEQSIGLQRCKRRGELATLQAH